MNPSYTTTQNPEDLLKAFKQFQNITPITLQPVDENTMKCPFQLTSEGKFNNCYLSHCMAFCSDGKTYWCARLNSKNKNKNSKQLNIKDNNNDID